MKRSEVNAIIQHSVDFFNMHHFRLPGWAYWPPESWRGKASVCGEIAENRLGWDITDFGSENFLKRGLVLFTIRNGSHLKQDKVYCEKIMIAEEDQETPLHFHWKKTEDIINRAGGNLVMELFQGSEEGDLLPDKVEVSVDGVISKVQPGEKLILEPGQSVCLKPYVYHRFYGEPGHGRVLIGEVSTVNDDASDNRFYEEIGRFPDIEEDVEPLHLLVSDYEKYL